MAKVIQATFIIMLLIFLYSFFATSWTGSYLMLKEDWKEQLVFTPETATEPQQIYEVDKFLFAFKIQPIMSMMFILSFFILAGMMMYWLIKKLRRQHLKGLS